MAKLTDIGLFNVTHCLAADIIVRTSFMISACRNNWRLTALDKTTRRRFIRFFTCSIVLPNVALACSLTRSDSNSVHATWRCSVQYLIHGSVFLLKRNHSINFLDYKPVANAELQTAIMTHAFKRRAINWKLTSQWVSNFCRSRIEQCRSGCLC